MSSEYPVTKVAKYRKRPVVIEAIQFQDTKEGIAAVRRFCPGTGVRRWSGKTKLEIKSREGMMTAIPGDWIVKGIQGEFYPCAPDIFEATYEPAEVT